MKLSRLVLVVALFAAGGFSSACMRGQARVVQGVSIKEDKPGLWPRATIPADVAMRTALARVPGGRITEAELEEENGHLVYSFDIRVEGKAGIEEVQVDARTGQIISVEHENK